MVGSTYEYVILIDTTKYVCTSVLWSSCLWYSMDYVPFHLFAVSVFPCLLLHGLHLNSVRLPASHVQLVVANTQGKDSLVDAKTR